MPIYKHTLPRADGTLGCARPTRTARTLPIDNIDGSASCSGCGAIVATEAAA